MILSYLLHGNIPFYDSNSPHPDPLLHAKLKDRRELLDLDIAKLTEHFAASRFSYSTQALPVNVLLDALIRPHGDDDTEGDTAIQWRHIPERAISHVVIGNAAHPGGQWSSCATGTTWDIQSLSYAGMLSLPGYSFSDHHRRVHGVPLPPFTRPSRRAVAEYLAAYPDAAGISRVFRNGQNVRDVSRTETGFYIGSHNIKCKHIVLASGVFSHPIPARPLLQPLLKLPPPSTSEAQHRAPLLVIGSGFSAADVIISAPRKQKIIHIFKWDPETNPSPLKACHYQAYPDYAGVYRLMRKAATQGSSDRIAGSVKRRRKDPTLLESRDWEDIYEALPNTAITDVAMHENNTATITFRQDDGKVLSRLIGSMAYAVGRRSTLGYLNDDLRTEILGRNSSEDRERLVSGQTLREQVLECSEVTKNVYIIGSLTGDSLIRFAYGACVYAAGRIMANNPPSTNPRESVGEENIRANPSKEPPLANEVGFLESDGEADKEYHPQLGLNRPHRPDVSFVNNTFLQKVGGIANSLF